MGVWVCPLRVLRVGRLVPCVCPGYARLTHSQGNQPFFPVVPPLPRPPPQTSGLAKARPSADARGVLLAALATPRLANARRSADARPVGLAALATPGLAKARPSADARGVLLAALATPRLANARRSADARPVGLAALATPGLAKARPSAGARGEPLAALATPRLAYARRSASARPVGLAALAVPVAPRVYLGWRIVATFRALAVSTNRSAGCCDPALPLVGVRFSTLLSGRCVRCGA